MKPDNAHAQHRTLRVGDRVRFQWGRDAVDGVIVEDRGWIGAGGRRLWRIEFHLEPTFSAAIELPEEDILVGT